MHPARELAGQRLIDHAVALEPALPFEGIGHDIHPEMRLPAGPGPGVALVPVRFIQHFEAFGGESRRLLLRDQIAGGHVAAYRAPCRQVNADARQVKGSGKCAKALVKS